MIQIHEDPTKIEFHRLALVALPLDEKLTSTVKRTINRHTNGTDKGMCILSKIKLSYVTFLTTKTIKMILKFIPILIFVLFEIKMVQHYEWGGLLLQLAGPKYAYASVPIFYNKIFFPSVHKHR